MILTGKKIEEEIDAGRITISGFDPERLGPNSYNLTLGDTLRVYCDNILHASECNHTKEVRPCDGSFLLVPGVVYLGVTNERTATDHYAPMLEGRSGFGRLGLQIHSTAGFGDVGFDGCWTLEITVTQPVRIRAGVEIAQIFYHELLHAESGEVELYHGKYGGESGAVGSRLWEE